MKESSVMKELRGIREKIYEEIKNMSYPEIINYFQKDAEEIRQKLNKRKTPII